MPISLLPCLFSCRNHSDDWAALSGIEGYIESRPDSALVVLESIKPDNLTPGKETAKHALYLSMALDKNYIDKTDFETLQPAIDYYSKHGSATDKLRTYYYQGRIYQNMGNNAEAINCYNNSIMAGTDSPDIFTKARSLYAQGYIYSLLYDWDKLIKVSLQAAELYKELNRKDQYLNCLMRMANAYSMKRETSQAQGVFSQSKELLDSVGMSSKSNYYATYLSYLASIPDVPKDEVKSAVSEYTAKVNAEMIDWLSVAIAYARIGDVQSAYEVIQRLSPAGMPLERARYYALSSEIYEKLDMPSRSLNAYKQYVSVSDSLDMVVYEQDINLMEERLQLEIKTLKESQRRKQAAGLFAIVASILLLTALWTVSRLRLSRLKTIVAEKETERYMLLYAQMEEERDNLNELLSQNKELDTSARSEVARRLELLNKFFTAHITDNSDIDRKASEEMEELLEDKEQFMNATRLAYAGSHPRFIKYLESKGLSDWEISYCCLYALGLRGKEVGAYIQMRSHYNISSVVREKLGISAHDTILGIYIRKLVNSFGE